MIAQDSSQDSREVASVVEQPSVNGDSNVLLEVEDETVRIDAETSRRTRREYGMDADGGQRLVVTIEEDRVASPDGGLSLVRSFAEPDVNGMTYTDMALLGTDSVQLLFRGFGGGARFSASSTEDALHGVIPLVAGVLKHRTLCLRHRHRGGPRSRPRLGICHGELVPNGVRGDAGKAFDQV